MTSQSETAVPTGRLRRARLGLGRLTDRRGLPEPPEVPVRVIEPRQPGVLARIREFWLYRQLVLYFGWQFLEKLYAKTWLGWLWVPLRPILTIAPRVMVFSGILGAPSNGVPYLIFFVIGFSAWQFFALMLVWSTRSIDVSKRVLRRIYVPRLTCLLGSLVPALVNLALYMLIAAVTLAVFYAVDGTTHLELGLNTLALPVGLVLMALLALAIGCFTSVYGANARDVRFGMSYLVAFWFFLTPVIYPLSEVPAALEPVVTLNPMTAPIEMIRLGLFDSGQIPTVALLSCLGTILAVGIPGLWFFNRSEALALDSL